MFSKNVSYSFKKFPTISIAKELEFFTTASVYKQTDEEVKKSILRAVHHFYLVTILLGLLLLVV